MSRGILAALALALSACTVNVTTTNIEGGLHQWDEPFAHELESPFEHPFTRFSPPDPGVEI